MALDETLASALVAVAIGVATLGAAERAVADETTAKKKTASLGWARLEGADACVATRDLAEGVEKILGRSVFVSASQADLSIEGRIEKRTEGPGFKATLTVSSAKGEPLGSRDLSTDQPDCHALDEEVELAIALMVDPEAALGPKPDATATPTASATSAPTAPPVKTVFVPVPTPPPPAPDPWRGDIAAGGAFGFGQLPSISLGVVAAGSLEPPWLFPLEGTLTFFVPQTTELPRGATATFFAFQGAGYACPLATRGTFWSVRVCGGIEGGFIAESSEGFDYEDPNESGLRGTFGAGLRGRADFRVAGPFGFAIAANLMVPILRDQFVYRAADGSEVNVFQVAPVTGTLEPMAVLAFP
jgi:hypothetical protein